MRGRQTAVSHDTVAEERRGRRLRLRPALVAATAVTLAATLSACDPRAWPIELVSVNAAGTDSANDESRNPQISPDGTKVAFESAASDLGPSGTGDVVDIFVRDVVRDTTTLVSVDAAGAGGGDDDSSLPRFSPDGTKIGFNSRATNLATPAAGGRTDDVYVRDLVAGTTTLVSVDAAGTGGGDDQSNLIEFSPDGRRVLFYSRAGNLVPGGPGRGVDGIYERDLASGVTTRLGDGFNATYSPSGDAVAFFANRNLYLREAATGTVRLLASGPQGSQLIGRPWFSHDGTKVAFERQTQPDWVRTDVYVYDRVARTSTLVTPAVSGGGGSNNTPTRIHGFHPSDPNRLLFSSFASNLIPGDTNGWEDLFVRDLTRRVTTRVATRVGRGSQGGPTGFVRWLGDGSRIAFVSIAGHFGVTDTNDLLDVYVLDVATRTFTLVSSEATGKAPANGDSGRYRYFPGDLDIWLYQLSASADGRRLAFGSYASDLGPKDSDRASDHDVYIATLAAP